MTYTEIGSTVDLQMLRSIARGCYQRALLEGSEAWSGATLRGTANSYGYWYKRSRENLLIRLVEAGFIVTEKRVGRGRRIVMSITTKLDIAVSLCEQGSYVEALSAMVAS